MLSLAECISQLKNLLLAFVASFLAHPSKPSHQSLHTTRISIYLGCLLNGSSPSDSATYHVLYYAQWDIISHPRLTNQIHLLHKERPFLAMAKLVTSLLGWKIHKTHNIPYPTYNMYFQNPAFLPPPQNLDLPKTVKTLVLYDTQSLPEEYSLISYPKPLTHLSSLFLAIAHHVFPLISSFLCTIQDSTSNQRKND